MPNPVHWFEIPVTDISRAEAFYRHVFGFELTSMEMGPEKMLMFPSDPKGTGAGGALIKSEGYSPSTSGALVYFSVEDIEGVLSRVNQKGGKTLQPKMAIGEHGFIGLFQDCEGNRVGLHSMK